MTTVLADYRHRVMVADSCVTSGSRATSHVKKIRRVRDAVLGICGVVEECEYFIDWFAHSFDNEPSFKFGGSTALVMFPHGLFIYDGNAVALQRVPRGRHAMGSGGQAAMAAYEALGWEDPVRAVRIACRHDIHSRPPVVKLHLKETS